MEFVLIMIAALALFLPVGEFYRLSLVDQALARATHEGARRAAADPARCGTAVGDAFQADALAAWLLDLNDDSTLGIVTNPADPNGWPSGSPTEEVQITIVADEDLFDATPWELATGGCGVDGSWIEVRSRVVIEPWFAPLRLVWPNGIQRQQQSWARNQA